MAVQAQLVQPAPDYMDVDRVAGIPVGDLVTPFVMTSAFDFTVESQFRAGRFPVPSAALGFLTSVADPEGDPPYRVPLPGLMPPYYIASALVVEGPYLEPTTGQIWPRIG